MYSRICALIEEEVLVVLANTNTIPSPLGANTFIEVRVEEIIVLTDSWNLNLTKGWIEWSETVILFPHQL